MKNREASIYDRLKILAQKQKRPFQEVLLYYAMERFLYRLSSSKHNAHFILKGALLFHVWNKDIIRATRDIDFLGIFNNDLIQVKKRIQEICLVEADDGIIFDPKSVVAKNIIEDADYKGVRISFTGKLSSAKIPMQLDIGFGDIITPSPQKLKYPCTLDENSFEIKAYPAETVIAEKLRAMVALDSVNSRMKDFFDIWFLANSLKFEGAVLQKAIHSSFENRRTTITAHPTAFSRQFAEEKQTLWNAFHKRLGQVAAPEKLETVTKFLAEFLNPILESSVKKIEFKKDWKPIGLWK